MKIIGYVSYALVLVGAINVGLWGFFQFDVFAWAFYGNETWPSRFFYALVGVAALWCLGYVPRLHYLCCEKKRCPCRSKKWRVSA